MRALLWFGLLVGLIAWNVVLRRNLSAARMRGNMYRDIAARLDQRIADIAGQER